MHIIEKKIDIKKSFVQLKISISTEEIIKSKYILFKKNNFSMPGFRKKTINIHAFKKLCDTNFLLNESINLILTKEAKNIETNENFSIISDLNVEQIHESTELNVILTINFIIKPIIKFTQNYKEISDLKFKNVEISEKEINDSILNYIDKLLPKTSIKDRSIQNKDIVNIDFKGYIDNKPFSGGSQDNYELIIGSKTFIPGFEEQLIGYNINDLVDVKVKFPESYHVKELQDKDVIFKCKINDILIKEIPNINDELIKKISKFETLQELKNDLNKKLLEYKEKENNKNFENQVLNKIIEIIDPNIIIPDLLIDNEINNIVDNFKNKLSEQNMSIENYLKNINISFEDFKNIFKQEAEKNVKTNLALEKIADIENINISNDEIDDFYKDYSIKYNITKERLKLLIDPKTVILTQKINKTIQFLIKNYK